jgi:hypothetical protein
VQHDHGTLEAHAVTTTTSKIAYTPFFDNSNMPDEAAKQADKDRRRTQFIRAPEHEDACRRRPISRRQPAAVASASYLVSATSSPIWFLTSVSPGGPSHPGSKSTG